MHWIATDPADVRTPVYVSVVLAWCRWENEGLGARMEGTAGHWVDPTDWLTPLPPVVGLSVPWLYSMLNGWTGQARGTMNGGSPIPRSTAMDSPWSNRIRRRFRSMLSWPVRDFALLRAVRSFITRARDDSLSETEGFRIAQRSPWLVLVYLALIPASATVNAHTASAALVEYILAEANGKVVALSDVSAYRIFSDSPDISLEEATWAVVDRHLLLDEADRFAVSAPPNEEVSSRLEELTSRLGGRESLHLTLTRLGWNIENLTTWIRDDLRIEMFLEQRVYFFVLIPSEDIEVYYEANKDRFQGRPLQDAREEIIDYLTRERGRSKRDQFLLALRERATIRVNSPLSETTTNPN